MLSRRKRDERDRGLVAPSVLRWPTVDNAPIRCSAPRNAIPFTFRRNPKLREIQARIKVYRRSRAYDYLEGGKAVHKVDFPVELEHGVEEWGLVSRNWELFIFYCFFNVSSTVVEFYNISLIVKSNKKTVSLSGRCTLSGRIWKLLYYNKHKIIPFTCNCKHSKYKHISKSNKTNTFLIAEVQIFLYMALKCSLICRSERINILGLIKNLLELSQQDSRFIAINSYYGTAYVCLSILYRYSGSNIADQRPFSFPELDLENSFSECVWKGMLSAYGIFFMRPWCSSQKLCSVNSLHAPGSIQLVASKMNKRYKTKMDIYQTKCYSFNVSFFRQNYDLDKSNK